MREPIQLSLNGHSEYKKDKRTENLTLRDIHVGDWVQVWSDITERYSPPLKITQICDDGTIYLITDEEERCTPWEEDIKDVDALPITRDILKGFGFDIEQKIYPDDEYEVFYDGKKVGELDACDNTEHFYTPYDFRCFFHEFQQDYDERGMKFVYELEWKGIAK